MWTRLRLKVTEPDEIEPVTAELWSMGAGGCEIRDGETFSELDPSSFTPPPNGADVVAFFHEDADPPDIDALIEQYPSAQLVDLMPFDDATWREGWKQFFVPTQVSSRVMVHPSWQEPEEIPDEVEVVLTLDPGMAFGTGTHESTRLAIKFIDMYLDANEVGSMLDVGCGSGILAMVASRLGAKRVLGIDTDPEAVEVARRNWELNRLGPAEAAPFEVRGLSDVVETFDLVVANILTSTLYQLRDDLLRVLAPGGRLVLSGLLTRELDNVGSRFRSENVFLEERRWLNEWGGLQLVRHG